MEKQIEEFLFHPTVGRLVAIFLGVFIIWFLITITQRKILRKIKDTDSRYRTRKVLIFAGYLLTIILIIVVFSDKLGGFTVALGVAGAGIAFALQEVIASFAGWLAIMFGGFYKTGDRVQLGGIKGDVIDIGMLRTTLMETGQWVDGDLYNGRIVRIANSFVFKEPVFNYSADFPFLWDEIKIPIQYGSDYQAVREILGRAAYDLVGDYITIAQETWQQMVNKYMIEDASTEPMVTLIANDNWVEFTLRYTVDLKKRRTIKNNLYLRILEDVDKTGGKIKFASATFQMVEGSELNVTLKKEK